MSGFGLNAPTFQLITLLVCEHILAILDTYT